MSLKITKAGGGVSTPVPKADLTAEVRTSLEKADTASQPGHTHTPDEAGAAPANHTHPQLHTHANKPALDRLGVSVDGILTIDGMEQVGGGGGEGGGDHPHGNRSVLDALSRDDGGNLTYAGNALARGAKTVLMRQEENTGSVTLSTGTLVQPVIIPERMTITALELLMASSGTGQPPVIGRFETDADGAPSGVLAGGYAVSLWFDDTAMAWRQASVGDSLVLDPGTYWLVLSVETPASGYTADWATDGTDYAYRITGTVGSNPYVRPETGIPLMDLEMDLQQQIMQAHEHVNQGALNRLGVSAGGALTIDGVEQTGGGGGGEGGHTHDNQAVLDSLAEGADGSLVYKGAVVGGGGGGGGGGGVASWSFDSANGEQPDRRHWSFNPNTANYRGANAGVKVVGTSVEVTAHGNGTYKTAPVALVLNYALPLSCNNAARARLNTTISDAGSAIGVRVITAPRVNGKDAEAIGATGAEWFDIRFLPGGLWEVWAKTSTSGARKANGTLAASADVLVELAYDYGIGWRFLINGEQVYMLPGYENNASMVGSLALWVMNGTAGAPMTGKFHAVAVDRCLIHATALG